MSSRVPCLQLSNRFLVPALGLGTWKSQPGEVTQAVKDAIDVGYRHIDCALIYGNEAEIGAAIKEKITDGTVKREELFITSKLWNTFHSPSLVIGQCKKSVSDLSVGYLDLYLMHWPMGFKEGGALFPRDENGKIEYSDVDYVDTWQAMEECVDIGLVRSLGLSNFNSEQIVNITKTAKHKPVMNQVECHPYLNQGKLLRFCRDHGILLTAYSPFGSPDRPWATPDDPKLLDNPKLNELGKKYNKTAAQIVLRYQVQRGIIPIPKSVNKSRILQNFSVFDFELSEEDMKYVDSFDCGGRSIAVSWYGDHKYFPFHIDF